MKNQREQKVKCKAIKSKWIAWCLRREGFQIKSVEPDRFNPERNVYIFKMVPGFQESLDQILENRQQNKSKWLNYK